MREVVCDCPLASVFSSLGTWGRTSRLQVWLEGALPSQRPGSLCRAVPGERPQADPPGLEQVWGGSRMPLQACSLLPPTSYLSILLTLRAGPAHPHPVPCSHPSLPPPHLRLSHHLFIPAPGLSCPIASAPQAPSLSVCRSLLGVPLAPALAVCLRPSSLSSSPPAPVGGCCDLGGGPAAGSPGFWFPGWERQWLRGPGRPGAAAAAAAGSGGATWLGRRGGWAVRGPPFVSPLPRAWRLTRRSATCLRPAGLSGSRR